MRNRISTGGGVIIALAIVLVAVIVCGAIGFFNNWTVCSCFGHKYGDDGVCVRCGDVKPIDKADGSAVVDSDGNVMDSDKIYAMPAGMVFSSAKQLNAEPSEETEKSVTITATIEPADATNQSVDWSVAFVNADSTWASGKTVTDYITVTPTSDGSLTATVTCKQAFGEQIQIICTARDNSEISAHCDVDYRKPLTNVLVTMPHMSGGNTSGNIYVYSTVQSNKTEIKATKTYGTGTKVVDDEVIVEYRLSDQMYGYLGSISQNNLCTGGSHTCTHMFSGYDKEWHRFSNSMSYDIDWLKTLIRPAANYTSGIARIFPNNYTVKNNFVCIRVTCGEFSREYTYGANFADWKIAVTNLTLNQGTLEF